MATTAARPDAARARLLEPLTCVRVALAGQSFGDAAPDAPPSARAQVAALPHVVDMISACLDFCLPDIWCVPRACELNYMHLLRRYGVRVPPIQRSDSDVNDYMFLVRQCSKGLVLAVQHDNLEMLAWVSAYCPDALPHAAMAEAAGDGNLRLLQWLVRHNPNAPWVPHMMDVAASAGQLQVLEWIYAHPRNVGCTPAAMISAVCNEHLATIAWLHAHYGRAVSVREADVRDAILNRRSRVVNYLVEHAEELCLSLAHMRTFAAEAGDLALVQRLTPPAPSGYRVCALRDAINAAAGADQLEVLQWLHAHHSCAFTADAMDRAASEGHFHVVQWLHATRTEGCTTAAMDGAASNSHFELVQWLDANRSEGCSTDAMDAAATNGRLDIVQWLHAHRAEGCTTKAMDGAAANGHLDVVRWLHANRSEGCTTDAMDSAALGRHSNVIAWLHQNRTEGCTPRAIANAQRVGYHDLVAWLRANRPQDVARTD